jgi:hypothetical protein
MSPAAPVLPLTDPYSAGAVQVLWSTPSTGRLAARHCDCLFVTACQSCSGSHADGADACAGLDFHPVLRMCGGRLLILILILSQLVGCHPLPLLYPTATCCIVSDGVGVGTLHTKVV